jgi:hypothetical protein
MQNRFLFTRSLLKLFFPHTCCGCGTELIEEDILFCFYCEASKPLTGFEFFPSNPTEKVFWGRVEIQAGAAHFYFTSGSSIQTSTCLNIKEENSWVNMLDSVWEGQSKNPTILHIVRSSFLFPYLQAEKRKGGTTRQA